MLISYQMINVYQLYIIQNYIGPVRQGIRPSPCPSCP